MTSQEEYILTLEDESRTLTERVSELTYQRNSLWRRVIALEAEVKNLNRELEGGER